MSPMTLKAIAISPPPPMPWMARKAISWGMFWARPQSTEPIRKITIARLEDRAPAVEVGDLAPQRGGGGRGEQIGGDHPGEVIEAAQIADDPGQGRADDALIQRRQQHPGHQTDQDDDDLLVAEDRCARRRRGAGPWAPW